VTEKCQDGEPEVSGMRPSGVKGVPTLLLMASDRDHSPSGGRLSGVDGVSTPLVVAAERLRDIPHHKSGH
jgi:hypothetical protein